MIKESEMRRLHQALEDANKYPPHLRIAVWLWSREMSFSEAHVLLYNGPYRNIPEPLRVNVLNSLRDIHNGTVSVTKQLQRLATNFV
jgi:endonuclease V-like protein UPF0215 family